MEILRKASPIGAGRKRKSTTLRSTVKVVIGFALKHGEVGRHVGLQ